MSQQILSDTSAALRPLDLPFLGLGCKWSLPATGGYIGGNKAGEAAAWMYMHYLQQDRSRLSGGFLQLIALSFEERLTAATSDDERGALRGQAVGFFSALGSVLRDVANFYKFQPFDELRTELQQGLDFDEAGFLAAENAREREEQKAARAEAARKGWERRRSKAA